MSDQRCPRCGAARRHGDQWCGLCYADFREPPPTVVGDGAQPHAPAEGIPPAAAAPAPGAAMPPLIRPPDQLGGMAPTPQPPAPQATPPGPTPPSPTIPTQTATPAAPAPPPGPTPFVPSTNPLAQTATAATQLPEGVAPAAPAAPADPAAGPGAADGEAAPAPELKWPCSRCDALVPMSEDYCSACGQGFLAEAAGETGVPKKAPLIGDLTSMNSGQKLMLGITIATGVILGMLALLFIGGSIF